MKPRKNFRTRPKKSGSKKRYRIKTQKKRLVAAGLDEEYVRRLTEREIRDKLQKVSRKKKPAKKEAPKKTVKKAKKKTIKKKAAKKS
ncbi:MAG: hypothetical protein WBD24_02925 [Candidatus Omnitrophota bacterium]